MARRGRPRDAAALLRRRKAGGRALCRGSVEQRVVAVRGEPGAVVGCARRRRSPRPVDERMPLALPARQRATRRARRGATRRPSRLRWRARRGRRRRRAPRLRPGTGSRAEARERRARGPAVSRPSEPTPGPPARRRERPRPSRAGRPHRRGARALRLAASARRLGGSRRARRACAPPRRARPAAPSARETCVVWEPSATVPRSVLVRGVHLVERRSGPARARLRAGRRPRPRLRSRLDGGDRPRRASRRACGASSSAGSSAGAAGRRRARLVPALAPAQERLDAERDESELDELAHGAMVPRPPEGRVAGTIRGFLPRQRLRPFPAVPPAVRPIQTEGRRTGT